MAKSRGSGASKPRKKDRTYNTETVEEAIARVQTMPTLIDEFGAEFFRKRAEEFDGRGIMCGSAPEFELHPAEKPKKKPR